jgi:hypothetical protein
MKGRERGREGERKRYTTYQPDEGMGSVDGARTDVEIYKTRRGTPGE